MPRTVCALLAVAHLAACTTLSTVPYGESAAGNSPSRAIAPGDRLRVTLREGGEKRIKVTSVTADQICAADGCIRATEIASIERAEVNVGAIVVLAVLKVLLLGALLAGLAKVGGVLAYGA